MKEPRILISFQFSLLLFIFKKLLLFWRIWYEDFYPNSISHLVEDENDLMNEADQRDSKDGTYGYWQNVVDLLVAVSPVFEHRASDECCKTGCNNKHLKSTLWEWGIFLFHNISKMAWNIDVCRDRTPDH